MQNSNLGNIIALDVGDARIGVAVGHTIARLPQPLGVISAQPHSEAIIAIKYTIQTQQEVIALVVGMPLSGRGQHTAQSKKVVDFCDQLKKEVSLPIHFVDESFSSVDADEYIKLHKIVTKHNDSIAACLVLQRYFDTQEVVYA